MHRQRTRLCCMEEVYMGPREVHLSGKPVETKVWSTQLVDNMGRRSLLLYGCVTQSLAMVPWLGASRRSLRPCDGTQASMVYVVQFLHPVRHRSELRRRQGLLAVGRNFPSSIRQSERLHITRHLDLERPPEASGGAGN